jgi:hypothetical protein
MQHDREVELVDEEAVNVDVFNAIKTFMVDLANATTNKDFKDYLTIVNHIDISKVKSCHKLISGFKNFIYVNLHHLKNDEDLEGLDEPNISFVTNSGSISFNFQKIFHQSDECDRQVIRDHLNHIWDTMHQASVEKEELYVEELFTKITTGMPSSGSANSQQQIIALSHGVLKDVMSDPRLQTLDGSKIVKIMCQKLKHFLGSLTTGEDGGVSTNCLALIESVENIDFKNFGMSQFLEFVATVTSRFDGLDLTSILTSITSLNLADSASFSLKAP